ncbi:MAG: esterase-like activity of phytase family protein [Vicinamibacteria bacterium]|nr:esterase-like activity of phytase family protein [Vicinamibacteria bacterium]
MSRVQKAGSDFASRVQGFLPERDLERVIGLALALGLLGLAFAETAPKSGREITLTAQSVPLSMADPAADQVGALRFLGGVALRSEDPGFGGLSGLAVQPSPGGWRVLAITDQGDKFTGRLVFEGARLRGIDQAAIEPLVDLEGKMVEGKLTGDAESITRLPDGRVLIGFERRHRIWAYGPDLTGPAQAFETPGSLSGAPPNGGLESLANWPDGRVLAISERMATRSGHIQGFLRQGRDWAKIEWTPSAPGFEPSDATVLPNGDLLVLERYWSAKSPTSISSRIIRVNGDQVRPETTLSGSVIAELKAPFIAENFEGITTFTNAQGKTEILLLSDDNFSGLQRTLLLSFEIRD